MLAEGSTLTADQVEQHARTLGPSLDYQGILHDLSEALSLLRAGEVDLVVISPEDPQETIQAGEHAVFTIYHNEIDPGQAEYVQYFSEIYIGEVNRRVLRRSLAESQSEAISLKKEVREARSQLTVLRTALDAGDLELARERVDNLEDTLQTLALVASPGLSLWDDLGTPLAPEEETPSETAAPDLLTGAQEDLADLKQTLARDTYDETDVESVERMEQDLLEMEERLSRFTGMDTQVLLAPFVLEVQNLTGVTVEPVNFYAPAVIALLMQHLAVTLGALSVVREQRVGTMELFRVAPLSAAETLLGKYLGYLVFGAIIAVALSLLLVFGIEVPLLGPLFDYVLILVTLTFTSLGFGFLISLSSGTDSQAVQYTMILLLTSVFFSGFFMPLEMLWEPVHVLSWLLPATYGIQLLQPHMLLGKAADLLLLSGLVSIGVLLFALSWYLLQRRYQSR